MTLWWIADALLLLVVIPAVVLILDQVLRPARQIKAYADDLAEHVGLFPVHLEALEELGRTQQLVAGVKPELERYVRALDQTP
jgi:hypothetical protein